MRQHSDELGRAAIEVLATEGSRAFTHRAVDRCANLPEGTASRYARTRAALLELAAAAMFVDDRRDAMGAMWNSTVTTSDDVTDLLVRATGVLLAAPDRFRARVELQLEARRTPTLQKSFHTARAGFVEPLAGVLDGLGYADARAFAELLVTTIEGILYRQLVATFPPLDTKEIRAILDAVVRARPAP